MGYVYELWDNFCVICDKASLFVSRSKDFFFSMMLVNYQAFSSVINTVGALWTSFSSCLSVSSEIIMWFIYGIIEFVTEVGSCLRSLVVLLWQLFLVFINVIFLIVSAIENFIFVLWNGGVGTVSALNTSVDILKESWKTACKNGEEFADAFFLLVIGGFETIGSFVVDIFLSVGKILSYFLSIPYLLRDVIDSCIELITNTMDYVWVQLTFSKEALFGVAVCLFLHVILIQGIKMSRSLNERGITFPIFRHYHSHSIPRFGNDIQISDNEEQDEEHDSNISEYDNSDSERVDDSETNDSDSISSEITDSDIDLPNYGNSLQQSRPPSPVINKPLNSTQLEREIEREKDKRKCVVCQDHVKTVLILPCKHMCLCVQCANHIVRNAAPGRNVCPLCRTVIQRVMDIYV